MAQISLSGLRLNAKAEIRCGDDRCVTPSSMVLKLVKIAEAQLKLQAHERSVDDAEKTPNVDWSAFHIKHDRLQRRLWRAMEAVKA